MERPRFWCPRYLPALTGRLARTHPRLLSRLPKWRQREGADSMRAMPWQPLRIGEYYTVSLQARRHRLPKHLWAVHVMEVSPCLCITRCTRLNCTT